MEYHFAHRMGCLPPSFLGELFRVSSQPGIISFAGGLPSSGLIDAEGLSRATCQVIEEEGALFGQRLRSPEAIEALTAFMQRRKPDFSRFS